MHILTESLTHVAHRRLNVIFHGLIAFRDAGTQHYDILIPFKGKTHHVAKYGNPLYNDGKSCSPEGLKEFPHHRSYFTLEGVRDGAATAARPSASNAVILPNGRLVPQTQNIRTIIRVPKPDVIRHYRGAETRGVTLSNDADTQALITTPPDVVYETTVFSYFFFNQAVLAGEDGDFPVPHVDDHYWNLCIYSQPETVCQENDNEVFNQMFNVRSTGRPLGMNLALRNAIADGPPARTSIGISPCELLALNELHKLSKEGKGLNMALAADEIILTSDPGGCGSAFICDGDGPSAP